MVGILDFHCHGPGSIPGPGTRSHKPCSAGKTKKAKPNTRILKNEKLNEINEIIIYSLKQTKFYNNEKSLEESS